MKEAHCYSCEKTNDETDLDRCAMCHRHFCEQHGFPMSGRTFCNSGCAGMFFFSEDPED